MRSSLRLSTALVAAASCSLLTVAPALAEDTDTDATTVESTGIAANEDENNATGTEDSDNEDEGKEDSDDAKEDGGSSDATDDGNTTPWLRILDASSKSKAAPIIGGILAVVSLLLAAYTTFGSQIPALPKLH